MRLLQRRAAMVKRLSCAIKCGSLRRLTGGTLPLHLHTSPARVSAGEKRGSNQATLTWIYQSYSRILTTPPSRKMRRKSLGQEAGEKVAAAGVGPGGTCRAARQPCFRF